MKRILAILVLITMAVGLAACGAAKESAGPTVDIGYSVPDTTNPFVGWLTGEVDTRAKADGLTVQIADSGSNAITQLEQIENFISMKVKVIALMPVDPNNVQSAIKKAQEAGIKVLVAGTDTGVYDVMMNINQYNAGEQIAEMGIDWLLENYSSDKTEAGLTITPKVIVIKETSTIDATNRSNGIIDKITKWGKAEVVVAQGESMTAADATTIMENMWQQNSDAQLILTYNADSAVGVNEYIMGQSNVDKSKIAVFSGDSSDPIMEVIKKSSNNESIFRGTMAIVGPVIDGEKVPLPDATYQILKGLADGTWNKGAIIEDAIEKTYGNK